MRLTAAVAAGTLALALALAGCGGDDATDANEATDVGTIREALLERLPGAQLDGDTVGYAPPGTPEVQPEVGYAPCTVPVILGSADEVELYREAGDDVITTPDGDAGVKITGPEYKAECLRAAEQALADVGS